MRREEVVGGWGTASLGERVWLALASEGVDTMKECEGAMLKEVVEEYSRPCAFFITLPKSNSVFNMFDFPFLPLKAVVLFLHSREDCLHRHYIPQNLCNAFCGENNETESLVIFLGSN